MKKLMLLGGTNVLIPVIERAHELGLYVITCDYLPENKAHKYADKYVNVSTMDKEAVLKTAENLAIDGIMSFACDSGVVSAAYVAEKMHLPFQCSYNSAKILQDKGLFRKFLKENNFNCPHAKRYEDPNMPYKDIDLFDWPVIVKPTDSAGSKGVTKVERTEDLEMAIKSALKNSHNKAFIIEDFLNFEGYHSSTDPFTVDGKIKFITYSDQLFDSNASNPYTPSYIIWPSTMKRKDQDILTSEIQRLMDLLEVKSGIYNIETCVANGKPYIMEVSPRGGGCKIAELQQLAYGVDLIENEIKKAVGIPMSNIVSRECSGHWCEFVLHGNFQEGGKLKNISIDPDIMDKYVKVCAISAEEGEDVEPFSGGNAALGDIIMRFDSREELNQIINTAASWLHIALQ